jgi:hypothetical protein
MALAITATSASPGPSSGGGDVVQVQALARVLVPGREAGEHLDLVGVHGDAAVVVRDGETADGIELVGEDGVEDLLHGWPPVALVVVLGIPKCGGYCAVW